MLGNFSCCNPTKLYFGEDALGNLNTELPKYGKHVVLIYGGGSVCGYAKAVIHAGREANRAPGTTRPAATACGRPPGS